MTWKDVVELESLLQSESLETLDGKFIDQRFIDYLDREFGSIDKINWRKFEGLAAEFFDRSGLSVALGPGRNDGNIDVRVWPRDRDADVPPTMLVQCKRQGRKASKVVVRALWADILHEHASSGLIVTTSALSAGAEKVCSAREAIRSKPPGGKRCAAGSG